MIITKEKWNPIIEEALTLLKKAFVLVNAGKEITFHLDDLTDTEKRLYTEQHDVELEIHYTKDRGIVYYPLGVRHFPGVRYYSDGSGEPDSQETYELGEERGYDKLSEAVERMLHECHMAHWQHISTALYEMVYCNQEEIDKELYGDTILG